jgi:hypothetical protein
VVPEAAVQDKRPHHRPIQDRSQIAEVARVGSRDPVGELDLDGDVGAETSYRALNALRGLRPVARDIAGPAKPGRSTRVVVDHAG